MATNFQDVYNAFLNKISDDLYVTLTPEDTERDLTLFLDTAIVKFEFPKMDVRTRDKLGQYFQLNLGDDEIQILAELMKQEWLRRQVVDMNNIKLKYSDKDFKVSSQANQLAKLVDAQEQNRLDLRHLQRLYGRRKVEDGIVKPNYSGLAGGSNGS